MTRFFPLLGALVLATPLWANPYADVVDVDILPGWRTDHGTHMAGLRITLAEGWKTYWRAPGDAGIPPSFDWSGSENISGVAMHWPVPEVDHSNGMRSIVYHDQIVIPMEFRLPEGDATAQIAARMQIGVCEEICVPFDLSFEATLLPDGGRDAQIMAALLDRPRSAAEAGVGAVTCALQPTENGFRVTTRITMPPMGSAEAVVIEAGDPRVWVSEPDTRRENGALVAVANMIHADSTGFALNRSEMRITVLAGGQAVDIRGCSAG